MKNLLARTIVLVCISVTLACIAGGQGAPLHAQQEAWPTDELWEKGDVESRVRYLEECARRNSRGAAIRMISTKVLEEKHPDVRAAVVRGIAGLTDPDAMTFLKKQLSFPNPEIREIVAHAFTLVPREGALEPLLAQLRTESVPQARVAMAAAIGCYNSKEAVKTLADMTAPMEPRLVREASIAALARIDLVEAFEALLACCGERDWTLHELIEDGLMRKREGEAADALAKVLTAALAGDVNSRRSEFAACAAGQIGDAGLLEPLRALLDNGGAQAKTAAIVALGRLNSPAAADVLIKVIGARDGTVPSELRVAASYSLPVHVPPSSAAAALGLLCGEKDWRVSAGLKYAVARSASASGVREEAERFMTPIAGMVPAGKLHSGDFKEVLDSVFGAGFDGWNESFAGCLGELDKFNKEWRRATSPEVARPEILSLRAESPPALLRSADSARTRAIRGGLEWLLRNQEVEGKWECAKHNPYHGAVPALDFALVNFGFEDETTNPAVTSLALLAFMSEGYTHFAGACSEPIRRGFDYLLSCQDERSGLINLEKGHVHTERCLPLGQDHGSRPRRYNHNISTLAVVEGYAMTGDPVLRIAAVRALEHSKNSWLSSHPWSFYLEPTDIGPSVYYVAAMAVAAQTDIPVARSEVSAAEEYMRQVTSKKDGRVYVLDKNPFCFGGFDSTATGVWAQRLLGRGADDEFIGRARAFIAANPPTWSSFHQIDWQRRGTGNLQANMTNEWYWLFGARALHSLSVPGDDPWFGRLEAILLDHQRHGGTYDGSWDPVGVWAPGGGRVYSTCFSIAALQSPYSYKVK